MPSEDRNGEPTPIGDRLHPMPLLVPERLWLSVIAAARRGDSNTSVGDVGRAALEQFLADHPDSVEIAAEVEAQLIIMTEAEQLRGQGPADPQAE